MSAEEQAHRAIDLIAATPPPENAAEELAAFREIGMRVFGQLKEARQTLRFQSNIIRVTGFTAAVNRAWEDWL
jgi:hypothetical protein